MPSLPKGRRPHTDVGPEVLQIFDPVAKHRKLANLRQKRYRDRKARYDSYIDLCLLKTEHLRGREAQSSLPPAQLSLVSTPPPSQPLPQLQEGDASTSQRGQQDGSVNTSNTLSLPRHTGRIQSIDEVPESGENGAIRGDIDTLALEAGSEQEVFPDLNRPRIKRSKLYESHVYPDQYNSVRFVSYSN